MYSEFTIGLRTEKEKTIFRDNDTTLKNAFISKRRPDPQVRALLFYNGKLVGIVVRVSSTCNADVIPTKV
jgi:hypothetical protein